MESKDALLALRKKHSLSQDEMAEKLFVTRQAVSRWENGETVPNTDTLKIISKTFGVGVDELLGTQKRRVNASCFDETGEDGDFIRDNIPRIVTALADRHAAAWGNADMLKRAGFQWQHQSEENLLAHISAMERDYKQYRADEEAGKIPAVWICEEFGGARFENHLDVSKLDFYETAFVKLREHYPVLYRERFQASKNITLIHGDFHPGSIEVGMDVKIKGKFAKIGLPTDDLAMFLALHTAPGKQEALPLLTQYYNRICETVSGYSQDEFMQDYALSVTEAIFSPIKLIDRGIYDFKMRDKALRAFEELVMKPPQNTTCQVCGSPLDDSCYSHEADGSINDQYCKWCYIDGTHKYHDPEEVIADVVPRWDWGTPEQMSDWLRKKLAELEYWKDKA
ncbi:MAG: helix-turn-helix domain-containing protein [Oscillospiraceae bacterium]|nr:helix-turn-helix domain-containing protein [Oscillospiraceae bacterium]